MPISTPHTLVRFLQTRDLGPQTWKTLVDHYGPAVSQWCARRGLQPADAEDVTQDVLVKMFRRLGEFEYDPARGFRPYLMRLLQSALADAVEQARRFAPPAGRPTGDTLDDLPARQDLEHALRERFDQEVLAEAMVRVAQRVEPKTWEAFRAQAFDGQPATAVAAALGMSVASAYKAKSNVQRWLRDEVRTLEGGDEAAVPPPGDEPGLAPGIGAVPPGSG